jgi:hypothetical protein
MTEENPEEKRQHPRVQWNFIMRFRIKDLDDIKWEISNIEDISVGGCLFYSPLAFQLGQILDIQVQLPRVQEFMSFRGEVKRIRTQKVGAFEKHAIAISFSYLEEAHKQKFVDTIDFFVKKQQQELS